ncbi:RNA polymerase sigma factor RpoE [Reinekea thalattae]|uniref:RNA polymerase sigma factor RpoE n=1 Tax=Reinekea thalattae TaxID=2593301 RepID=A0A5C8Z4X6_9GAMM|nr:RNA polymerase sigma factor RpoE [Reinekea thalattae]TXR53072.1 RNA polymerase sigma factor RpoE [Reinekea thalattae]
MERTADADLLLVQRAQGGDSRAFDLLVLKYQHKVASVVAKYVSEQDIIEDLVQDSFIKAYRAIGGFRGDAGFFTWMYRIATNTAKNHLESMGRKPSYRGKDIDEVVKIDTPEHLRDYDTPDNLLAKNQLDRQLQKTIADLPDDLRVAITLREFEDRSYQEISDIMDTPIGTVRSRIFRAREVIETELKHLLTDSDRTESSHAI